MTTIRLYRGITVPVGAATATKQQLLTKGESGQNGRHTFLRCNPHPPSKEWIKKLSPLNPNEILQNTDELVTCACGDKTGGAFYACRGLTQGRVAILIEFDIPVESIYIDARDFLCPAFQMWDNLSTTMLDQQRKILSTLFGSTIALYFDRATETKDQLERIALCNLAAHDRDVIQGHLANKRVIRGRYGTVFCSAFFVSCPIPATAVVDVHEISMPPSPSPWIDLEGFRSSPATDT